MVLVGLSTSPIIENGNMIYLVEYSVKQHFYMDRDIILDRTYRLVEADSESKAGDILTRLYDNMSDPYSISYTITTLNITGVLTANDVES